MSHKLGVAPTQPTPSTKPPVSTPTTPKPTTPTTTGPTTPTTAYAAARELVHAAREHRSHRVRVTSPTSCRRSSTRCRTTRSSTFPAGAQYRIEGTLVTREPQRHRHPRQRREVLRRRPDRDRSRTPRIRSQFDFRNMSNLLVEDMVIRGAHPNGGQDDDAYVAAASRRSTASTSSAVSGSSCATSRSPTSTATSSTSARARHPVFGSPTDIWIHDNYLRRNGRQGIAATHGFNIVIERNDIARHTPGDVRPRAGERDAGRSATCGSATTRSGPVA